MTDLTGRKPILCLDFDGVCHSYTSGWKGADVIPDPAVPGLWEFLEAVLPHFEVNIFSSRTAQEGGLAAMKEWFRQEYSTFEWNLPSDSAKGVGVIAELLPGGHLPLHFPTEKPPAFVGIDDRVLTFTGKWPSVEELKNFQPWNKRGVSGQCTLTQTTLEEHTKAVGEFLTELHAIMIDPLADGVTPVPEMCKLLLETARRQREQLHEIHQRAWPINNASWPKGAWISVYDPEADLHILKTEYGGFVASVGPTLAAHAFMDTNNAALKPTAPSGLVAGSEDTIAMADKSKIDWSRTEVVPDSAAWWRQVAQRLAIKVHEYEHPVEKTVSVKQLADAITSKLVQCRLTASIDRGVVEQVVTEEIVEAGRAAAPVLVERGAGTRKLSAENLEFLSGLTREGGHRKWTTMELVHVHQGLEKLLHDLARAEAELHQWSTWGVIEIALRNPNVSSYMKEWEERATTVRREALEEACKIVCSYCSIDGPPRNMERISNGRQNKD